MTSPKFVAAAVTTAKVPIFLESVQRKGDGIDTELLQARDLPAGETADQARELKILRESLDLLKTHPKQNP